jgi:hypothetical protein
LVSVLTVLDKLGYIPLASKAEHIVSESIKKAFETLFGLAVTKIMLDNLSSLYGLSEWELTTNYDIFEKLLYKISGYGANIILGYIKKEILLKAVTSLVDSEITEEDIVDPYVGISDIIKKISYDEITGFVSQSTAKGMHIVFIHEGEDTKYKILSAFFRETRSRNTTSNLGNQQISITKKGLITTKKTKSKSKSKSKSKLFHIDNIFYYEDLIDDIEEDSKIPNKVWDWINSFKDDDSDSITNNIIGKDDNKKTKIAQSKDDIIVVTSAPPSPSSIIRIAIEDASWFVLNSFRRVFASVEETISKNMDNLKSTSIMCTYKISDISKDNAYDEDMIMGIVGPHPYVILEDPLTIYKR